MLRLRKQIKKQDVSAQTLLEYVVVVSVILAVLFAMSAAIRRGSQTMMKVVADQIGNQETGEQEFDDSGHLVASLTNTSSQFETITMERLGTVTKIFNETTYSYTNSVTNLGFQETAN